MTQITLEYNSVKDTVAELGGGTRPILRPNIDIRKAENVDIVADLNYSIPLKSELLTGLFAKFVIEHISWHNVRRFIAECYRVLKDEGKVILITANLLEQARKLVETEEEQWNEELICMIFGGQGEEEGIEAGSHKCGFSPKYACKLFGEAGFTKVDVFELPGCKTDLIIQAIK